MLQLCFKAHIILAIPLQNPAGRSHIVRFCDELMKHNENTQRKSPVQPGRISFLEILRGGEEAGHAPVILSVIF